MIDTFVPAENRCMAVAVHTKNIYFPVPVTPTI
jgi:hypothetical protein